MLFLIIIILLIFIIVFFIINLELVFFIKDDEGVSCFIFKNFVDLLFDEKYVVGVRNVLMYGFIVLLFVMVILLFILLCIVSVYCKWVRGIW